jgi:hypothetical protein
MILGYARVSKGEVQDTRLQETYRINNMGHS